MRGIPFFVRAAFESGTMNVPAGAGVDGEEKRLQSFGQGFRIIKFSEARVFKEAKVMVQCRSGGRNDITRNIRSDKRRTNRQM